MAKDLLHTAKFYHDSLCEKLYTFSSGLDDLEYCISALVCACSDDIDDQLTLSEVKRCILDMAEAMKTICECYNDLDAKEMIERIPVEKGS